MGKESAASREERLQAKLRENLRRRKAQARALQDRESGEAGGGGGEEADSALPKSPEGG